MPGPEAYAGCPFMGRLAGRGLAPLCGGQRAGRPTHFPEPAAPRSVGDAALYRLPQKYLRKTKSDHLLRGVQLRKHSKAREKGLLHKEKIQVQQPLYG